VLSLEHQVWEDIESVIHHKCRILNPFYETLHIFKCITLPKKIYKIISTFYIVCNVFTKVVLISIGLFLSVVALLLVGLLLATFEEKTNIHHFFIIVLASVVYTMILEYRTRTNIAGHKNPTTYTHIRSFWINFTNIWRFITPHKRSKLQLLDNRLCELMSEITSNEVCNNPKTARKIIKQLYPQLVLSYYLYDSKNSKIPQLIQELRDYKLLLTLR
jgi:hypothetical protein